MSGRTYQEQHPGETCTEQVCAGDPCGKIAVGAIHGAWPRCAEHLPRVMSPEEREVVEAAKAWAKDLLPRWTAEELKEEHRRLFRAVDALPKPAPSLVERIRKQALKFGDAWGDVRATMLEAADELERRGAK